jgi:hypothetical protein
MNGLDQVFADALVNLRFVGHQLRVIGYLLTQDRRDVLGVNAGNVERAEFPATLYQG